MPQIAKKRKLEKTTSKQNISNGGSSGATSSSERWPVILSSYRSLSASKQQLEAQKAELAEQLANVDREIERVKGKLFPFQRCAMCEKNAKTTRRMAIPCASCGIPLCARCVKTPRCVEEQMGRESCLECDNTKLCANCLDEPGTYAEACCGLIYCTLVSDCHHGKDGNTDCEHCKSFMLFT